MAHIEKRARNIYRARYRAPNGRERSQTFKRRADAERFLAEMTTAKARGAWVDPRAGRKLLEEWAAECMERRDLRPTSAARDEVYMRRHVLPRFGDVPLARIERRDVQRWVGDLSAKGLAPATVRACHRLLSGVLAEAVEERLIPQSPCRGVRLPRIPRTEQRFLTTEQVERLAESIAPEYRALIYCAAYLGCRWGELVGLKRENVNLLRRELTIQGTLEEVSGGLTYVEETKTKASRRRLTLPAFLVEILTDHLARAVPSEYVFTGRDGGLLRRSNFRRRHWKPAGVAAGLTPLRFHDLRHTCAGILIAQGAHPAEIKARLGHTSIKTTMDVYGHLLPSLGDKLDEALDAARADARSNISRPERGLATIDRT
ncbi:MAG: tyrosine-type recombinase/integrase [Actinomycetota bacterium]